MNPAKFIREVRSETSKVTWPTRKETWISTMMVLFLATLASIFFVIVDWFIGTTIRAILGF
ncbi:MAG: preprotein translocase subunit SecE [Alphaproteobacteria bacterium]